MKFFESNMISENEVWQMFFDGASRTGRKGKIIASVGVVFISTQNHVLPRAFSLTDTCSNNVAEYNALLIGLQLAYEMGVRYLEAYGDSKLIVNQVKGEYEIRHEDLVLYYHVVIKMANSFDGFYISHVSQSQNTKADALAALVATLAALVATLALPIDTIYHFTVATRRLVCPKHVLETNEVHVTSIGFKPRDWRFSLIDYALHDILPDDLKEVASIRRSSLRFYYDPIEKYSTVAHMTVFYSVAYLILKHKRCLRKNMLVYAELIGPKLKDRLH